jgi:hypothetical protein
MCWLEATVVQHTTLGAPGRPATVRTGEPDTVCPKHARLLHTPPW